MKICKVCKSLLSDCSFYNSKNHLSGLRTECKACTSVYWKFKNSNNREDYKVYLLKDKVSGEIKYVGCTSQSLMKRLRDHIGDSKVKRGSVSICLVQDRLTEAQALTMETMLIQQYKPELNTYLGYKIHEKHLPKYAAHPNTIEAARKANSRPILCLTNGKTYSSIREASKSLSLSESKISLVCQGKRPHTKQYIFSYL